MPRHTVRCYLLLEKLICMYLFVNCAVYLFWLSAAQHNRIVWLPCLCFVVFVFGGRRTAAISSSQNIAAMPD